VLPQGAQLALLVVVALDLEVDVGAIEAADDHRRIAQPEALDDLLAHRRRGRRGEREHGRAPERLHRRAEAQVVGPEVVPPLGDAVRLVDDEQRGLRDRELVEHVGVGELLGCEEHELQRVLGQLGERRGPLGGRDVGVQLRGAAGRPVAQILDLLALQGDQGRDDDGRARDQQAGDLVDRRLARAGRHHDQRVAPGQRRLDRLALPGAQALEAERLAGDAVDPVHGGGLPSPGRAQTAPGAGATSTSTARIEGAGSAGAASSVATW